MKQKTVIIILAIALAVSVGLNLGGIGMFTLARIRARSHVQEPGQSLVYKLRLSAEQREALGNARRELAGEVRPLREEMEVRRRAAMELLSQPELDSARRDELFGEIAQLQARMEKLVFDKLFETKSVLRPQQQELLLRMVEREFGPRPGAMMPQRPGARIPRPNPERSR